MLIRLHPTILHIGQYHDLADPALTTGRSRRHPGNVKPPTDTEARDRKAGERLPRWRVRLLAGRAEAPRDGLKRAVDPAISHHMRHFREKGPLQRRVKTSKSRTIPYPGISRRSRGFTSTRPTTPLSSPQTEWPAR